MDMILFPFSFNDELEKIKAQGLLRTLRTVSSGPGPEIEVDGRRVLNFCSNDYLGLAGDPRLIEAAAEAARRYGAGSGAARLISGNSALCDELEASLAGLKGTEAALLFNSGYHANIGVIPALASEGDVIFSDELNHASLIDGCRLSKAETVVYRHLDLNHLEDLLKTTADRWGPSGERGFSPDSSEDPAWPVRANRRRVIVTEAVFSMEGDVCPLDDLLKLAQKYEATVYLDEAHAVGVFGDQGEGLVSQAGARHASNLLICMGTLGKAFGSYGAFVAGSKSLRDFLINKARSFIFTTALPPAVLAASLAAVKIVQKEPERREKLWENVRRYGKAASPIISIPVGDARKTMEISQKLFEAGIYLQGIRPPTVPEGTSRLRLTVSAAHTDEHLERLVMCLNTI